MFSKSEIVELLKNVNLSVTKIVGTGYNPSFGKLPLIFYNTLNKTSKFLHFPPARWLLITNTAFKNNN